MLVLFLLLCGLFYEAMSFTFCRCYFVLVFFSPLSIAITSLLEDRANLRRAHGRMDALKNNVAIAHPYQGSDVANLVEFRPVVKEEIACQTAGRSTDARMDEARKINVAFTHPYHEGK